MFDYSKVQLIIPPGYDNYGAALSSVNLLICWQYTWNGNARINRMDRAGICTNSGCNGRRVEDKQATTGPGRGRGPLMDYYTMAGLVAMALLAGLIGFRLAKDEMLLRRKTADGLVFKAGA